MSSEKLTIDNLSSLINNEASLDSVELREAQLKFMPDYNASDMEGTSRLLGIEQKEDMLEEVTLKFANSFLKQQDYDLLETLTRKGLSDDVKNKVLVDLNDIYKDQEDDFNSTQLLVAFRFIKSQKDPRFTRLIGAYAAHLHRTTVGADYDKIVDTFESPKQIEVEFRNILTDNKVQDEIIYALGDLSGRFNIDSLNDLAFYSDYIDQAFKGKEVDLDNLVTKLEQNLDPSDLSTIRKKTNRFKPYTNASDNAQFITFVIRHVTDVIKIKKEKPSLGLWVTQFQNYRTLLGIESFDEYLELHGLEDYEEIDEQIMTEIIDEDHGNYIDIDPKVTKSIATTLTMPNSKKENVELIPYFKDQNIVEKSVVGGHYAAPVGDRWISVLPHKVSTQMENHERAHLYEFWGRWLTTQESFSLFDDRFVSLSQYQKEILSTLTESQNLGDKTEQYVQRKLSHIYTGRLTLDLMRLAFNSNNSEEFVSDIYEKIDPKFKDRARNVFKVYRLELIYAPVEEASSGIGLGAFNNFSYVKSLLAAEKIAKEYVSVYGNEQSIFGSIKGQVFLSFISALHSTIRNINDYQTLAKAILDTMKGIDLERITEENQIFQIIDESNLEKIKVKFNNPDEF